MSGLVPCGQGCGPEYYRVCAGCYYATKRELERLRAEVETLKSAPAPSKEQEGT